MHRLVVIDDEYIVVEGIKAMIARQKLDYEVVGWAYDGIEALEVIRNTKPDLVITDIRIPGLDGLSLIELVKEELPDLIFVVISGYTEFEYARRALSLGVKGYIDKPISIDKLNQVLERVEKEWNTISQEKSENSDSAKKKYQEIEELSVYGIKALTGGEAQEFQSIVKKLMEKILKLYPEISDFRRELYKHLCVFCDILLENHKNIERANLVSYQQIIKKTSIKEICDYAQSILADISKHITADQTGSSHHVILELLNYINEHYNEDIGLGELADRVRMSTAYLSVLFKTEVGISYVKYLTDLRIRNAKKLLQEGYKINEVSDMVGYSNYRYFCDIFKKHEGQTPNEYKAKMWK